MNDNNDIGKAEFKNHANEVKDEFIGVIDDLLSFIIGMGAMQRTESTNQRS